MLKQEKRKTLKHEAITGMKKEKPLKDQIIPKQKMKKKTSMCSHYPSLTS